MCQICGQPAYNPCGCTDNTGCIVKLDATCILYHKNNNQITGLDNLGLTNGATLELFMETVDDYIGQIKPGAWDLPFLRTNHTINTMQQFAVSVDTEFAQLPKFKGNVTVDPTDLVDGDYWFRTDLLPANGLRMKLNGSVRTIPTT